MGNIVTGGQIADHHTFGTGRVDKLSVTNVYAHMGNTGFIGVLEKHQITTLPDILLKYRIHGRQVTQNPSARYLELLRTLKIVLDNHLHSRLL